VHQVHDGKVWSQTEMLVDLQKNWKLVFMRDLLDRTAEVVINLPKLFRNIESRIFLSVLRDSFRNDVIIRIDFTLLALQSFYLH
jgi:hypothetical protein